MGTRNKLKKINELKEQIKELKKQQDQLKSEVISEMGRKKSMTVGKFMAVWKETNHVVVGHGRLEAMKKLGWPKVAVDYQSFTDYEQMYAHMTADNGIATWAELDLKDINEMFTDFGPEFDVDLLGLKDFHVEPLDKLDVPKLDDIDEDDDNDDEIECPNCGERFKK